MRIQVSRWVIVFHRDLWRLRRQHDLELRKMLRDPPYVCTSVVNVSIRTAVCTVIWSEPAIRAPLSGSHLHIQHGAPLTPAFHSQLSGSHAIPNQPTLTKLATLKSFPGMSAPCFTKFGWGLLTPFNNHNHSTGFLSLLAETI